MAVADLACGHVVQLAVDYALGVAGSRLSSKGLGHVLFDHFIGDLKKSSLARFVDVVAPAGGIDKIHILLA